jgi:predicted  nucleic acid-binding Zn-ribbon protein
MTSGNVDTDVLHTLHRIHRQLSDLRERLQRGPKLTRANQAAVNHREKQLAEAQADTKAIRINVDRKQLLLKTGEDKVKDLKLKLNSASSNREYQALKDQVAAQEMTNSVLADEILEGMEKIDALQQKTAEAEANLAKAQQKNEQVRSEVEQQAPLIQGDMTRLESELGECETSLPASVREFYNRMVRQRGQDALAAVENEYCGGCHQRVPLNVCAEIMLSHPMFCKTCGRLLYILKDDPLGS